MYEADRIIWNALKVGDRISFTWTPNNTTEKCEVKIIWNHKKWTLIHLEASPTEEWDYDETDFEKIQNVRMDNSTRKRIRVRKRKASGPNSKGGIRKKMRKQSPVRKPRSQSIRNRVSLPPLERVPEEIQSVAPRRQARSVDVDLTSELNVKREEIARVKQEASRNKVKPESSRPSSASSVAPVIEHSESETSPMFEEATTFCRKKGYEVCTNGGSLFETIKAVFCKERPTLAKMIPNFGGHPFQDIVTKLLEITEEKVQFRHLMRDNLAIKLLEVAPPDAAALPKVDILQFDSNNYFHVKGPHDFDFPVELPQNCEIFILLTQRHDLRDKYTCILKNVEALRHEFLPKAKEMEFKKFATEASALHENVEKLRVKLKSAISSSEDVQNLPWFCSQKGRDPKSAIADLEKLIKELEETSKKCDEGIAEAQREAEGALFKTLERKPLNSWVADDWLQVLTVYVSNDKLKLSERLDLLKNTIIDLDPKNVEKLKGDFMRENMFTDAEEFTLWTSEVDRIELLSDVHIKLKDMFSETITFPIFQLTLQERLGISKEKNMRRVFDQLASDGGLSRKLIFNACTKFVEEQSIMKQTTAKEIILGALKPQLQKMSPISQPIETEPKASSDVGSARNCTIQ